eukprot:scaffold6456_cov98-Isochrysis_galbana.AAC.1
MGPDQSQIGCTGLAMVGWRGRRYGVFRPHEVCSVLVARTLARYTLQGGAAGAGFLSSSVAPSQLLDFLLEKTTLHP